MASSYLYLALTASIALSTGARLCVWREHYPHQQTDSKGVLEMLMGDSRRLFANHFITKADVYLHSGVYPSIFDQAQRARRTHLADMAGTADQTSDQALSSAGTPAEGALGRSHDHDHDHDHEEADAVTGLTQRPRDWIDRFGRNFYPTRHTHLESSQEQREILPWFQLAAELNPNEVETFTVGAYWLRQRMGKVQEAEDFLRQGWRANPDSYDILFELARLQEESRNDDVRARNLLQLALRKWAASQPGEEKPDELTFMQILGHLARIEERAHHTAKAIEYLEWLSKVSPAPQSVRQQIAALRAEGSRSVQ